MTFADKINEYIDILHCSASELAAASGISDTILSRYRSGKRTPAENSEYAERLITGIARLAGERSLPEITPERVRTDLHVLLSAGSPKDLPEKLDQLIKALNINASRMAKAINYDASFLSRIRTGKRIPSDSSLFVSQLSSYVVVNYSDDPSLSLLSDLLGRTQAELADQSVLSEALHTWFFSASDSNQNNVNQVIHFLQQLDHFDLNDYIRAISFPLPPAPATASSPRSPQRFVGVDGQKNAELRFLSTVASSATTDPLFMYSDMDMTDMSEDREFSKNWMYGLAMVLRKGQPIVIIHNLNRPFHELMLGLEAYIPLYMTGLVSPYYLKGTNNAVFRHFLYTTDICALTGEGVSGFHDQARFLLTADRSDIAYCRERANCLIQKASPLMDIYTNEKKKEYEKFWASSQTESGKRRMISASLPVFTLSPGDLERILHAAGLSGHMIALLCDDAAKQRAYMETLLQHETVLDELPLMQKEEFEAHPTTLFFPCSFVDTSVTYSYEEYVLHLNATKQYAAEHPNYQIVLRSDFIFRNIHIDILQEKWVWISKHTSPAIHFVIHHPQLRKAIEKMYAPITDGET